MLMGSNGGAGGIWHPLSSIKMENNQNEHKLEHDGEQLEQDQEQEQELEEGDEIDADGGHETEAEDSEKRVA